MEYKKVIEDYYNKKSSSQRHWLASSNVDYPGVKQMKPGEWYSSQSVPSDGTYKVHISVDINSMKKALEIFTKLAFKEGAPKMGWKVASTNELISEGQAGKQIVVVPKLGEEEKFKSFLIDLHKELSKEGVKPDPRPFNTGVYGKERGDKVLTKYFGYRVEHHAGSMKWSQWDKIENICDPSRKLRGADKPIRLYIGREKSTKKWVCFNLINEPQISTVGDIFNNEVIKGKYKVCGYIEVSPHKGSKLLKITDIAPESDYLKRLRGKKHLIFPGLDFDNICGKLEELYGRDFKAKYIKDTFNKKTYLDEVKHEINPRIYSQKLQELCESFKKLKKVWNLYNKKNLLPRGVFTSKAKCYQNAIKDNGLGTFIDDQTKNIERIENTLNQKRLFIPKMNELTSSMGELEQRQLPDYSNRQDLNKCEKRINKKPLQNLHVRKKDSSKSMNMEM